MNLQEWANCLEPTEKAYVSQCFKYWQGHNGDREPDPPPGISRSRSEILLYHTKSFLEPGTRRRKMEELQTISFRVPEEFYRQLAFDAAQVDVNISIFIRSCILLASSQIKANPNLVNFFSKAVIPK